MAEISGPLADKAVLITGAGNGVGRAAALLAASRGAQVLCVDRDETPTIDTVASIRAAGGSASYRVADITSEKAIGEAISDLVLDAGGVLDAVVHVAGIMRGQRLALDDLTLDTWNEVILTNLTGAFLVAKHGLRNMNHTRDGVVVLVASRSGIVVPSGSLAYGASKGGMHGFAMSLDKQLAATKIRLHTVCPGDVDTPLMRASLDEALVNGADPVEVDRIRNSLGTAEHVASAIVHLIDPAARGISGTVLAG